MCRSQIRRIRGRTDFDFPTDASIKANTSVVVLSFDPTKPENQNRLTAFKTQYGISGDVSLFGGYSGSLSDSQQLIRLESPGVPVMEFVPYYTEDYVIYDDRTPWPVADGNGLSIHRSPGNTFGNNAANWSAQSPSPGSIDAPDLDLDGDGEITPADIDFACSAVKLGLDYDFNGDGQVNNADVTFYVEEMLGTGAGDANLDGTFDSQDLVSIFRAGEFEDEIEGNSTWADGDWNCDGDFGTSDLVAAFRTGRYVAAALPAVGLNDLSAGGRNIPKVQFEKNHRRARVKFAEQDITRFPAKIELMPMKSDLFDREYSTTRNLDVDSVFQEIEMQPFVF